MLRTRIFKLQLVSFTRHHFNIHSRTIEMFRVHKNISATIIDDILTRSYHSRAKSILFFNCAYWSIFYAVLWSPYLKYQKSEIEDSGA